MSVREIENVLTAHAIPTMQHDGRIYGLEEWTENGRPGAEWRDMTGWSLRRLRDWLGY